MIVSLVGHCCSMWALLFNTGRQIGKGVESAWAEKRESRMRYLIREWIWGEWVFIPKTYNPEIDDLVVKQTLNSDLELSAHRKIGDRFQTH